MRTILVLALLALGAAGRMAAAETQGVLVAWDCAQQIVKNGREKALKRNHSCSLVQKYDRTAYGLLTGDNKCYRLDGEGTKWAQMLLKNSPNKDNLFVVVRGTIEGDTIDVKGITEL